MLSLLKFVNNDQCAPVPSNWTNNKNKSKKNNTEKSQNPRRKYSLTHGSCPHTGKECN